MIGIQHNLTLHAQERARQRGISQYDIDLVRSHGRAVFDERGRKISVQGVPTPRGIDAGYWNALRAVIVVENQRGRVVTVYRCRPGRGAS